MLRFMGSQRVGHDCATELNCGHRWTWTDLSMSAGTKGKGYLGLLACPDLKTVGVSMGELSIQG